jgi:hypothetical protein
VVNQREESAWAVSRQHACSSENSRKSGGAWRRRNIPNAQRLEEYAEKVNNGGTERLLL